MSSARRLAPLVLGAIASATAWADDTCPVALGSESLETRLTEAEQAWTASEAAVVPLAASLSADLSCLDHVISTGHAARLHRLRGLAALEQEATELALFSFAMARAVDPELDLSDLGEVSDRDVVQLGFYDAVPPSEIRRADFTPPEGLETRFDGAAAVGQPLNAPTILVYLDEDGQFLSAHLLEAGEQPPEPPAAPGEAEPDPATQLTAVSPSLSPTRAGPSGRGLTVAGLATGALAAGLYTYTYFGRAVPYRSGEVPGDREQFRRTTNSLVLVSAGTGLAGAGLFIGGQLSGTW